MPHRRENHLAIITATALFWVFGGIWYTALSAPWLAATGRTKDQVERYGAVPFIAAVVLCWLASYAIAKLLSYSPTHNAGRGLQIGVFLAICIYGTVALMQVLFEGRDMMLFAIDGGYAVLGMALAGAVIGWMNPGAVS
jgi:Protein of unknown function (DUF1761)